MNINELIKRFDLEKHILETILLNSEFTEKGWFFKNTSIHNIEKIYHIYRMALLDGLIPLCAVAGINLKQFENKSVFDVTNYKGIKESLFSLLTNFENLFFKSKKDEFKLKTNLNTGYNYALDLKYYDKQNKEIKPLTNPFICYSDFPTEINLRIIKSTEISRAYKNAENVIMNKKYLPLRTNCAIYRFVNVIGYNENVIYHKIISSIDLEMLKHILIEAFLGNNDTNDINKNIVNVRDIISHLYNNASLYGKSIKAIQEIYYTELKNSKSFTKINDEYFYLSLQAEKADEKLSANNDIVLKKTEKEFEIFKNLFICNNEEETANRLLQIKRVSDNAAIIIARIIHEYI